MSILDRIRNSAEKEREEQARERAASLLSGSGVTPASDMLAGATRRNETKQQPQQQGNIRDRLRSAARYEAQQRAEKRVQQRQEDEAKKVAERKARYDELQEKITAYDSVSKEMTALMLNPDYAGSDRERVGELAELKSWFEEMGNDIDAIKAEYEKLAPQVRQDNWNAENARYGTYLKAEDFAEHSKKGSEIPSFVNNGSRNYSGLTDDEKNVYYYLLSKEGNDSANKFLDHMQEALNARAGAADAKTIQGIENDFLRGAASIGYSGIGAVSGFVDGMQQAFTDEVTATPSSVYGTQIVRENTDSDFVKTAMDVAGVVGGQAVPYLVAVAMSHIPGLQPVAAKLVAGALMGMSVKGNKYKEGLARGMTEDQAQGYSVLVGASEGALGAALGGISSTRVTESKLLAKALAIDNGIMRALAVGGVHVGNEIVEEELQNYLEPLFRTIVTGEEYDAPTVEELTYTALVTALSTGILEAPSMINAGSNRVANLGKELQGLGDDTVQSIIEEGLATDKDTVSRNLAQSMQDKLARGEKLTAQEVGALYRENVQTVESDPAEAQDPLEAAAREVVARENEAAQEASQVGQRGTDGSNVKSDTVLGDYGKRAITEIAEESGQTAEQTYKTVEAAYLAGRTNQPRTQAILTDEVQTKAYEAGRRDNILDMNKNPLAEQGKTEYTGIESDNRTEGLNNGTAEEVHLRNGSQWAGGAHPGRTLFGLEKGAGRDQSRKAQAGSADVGTASLSYGEKVSTSSLGIAGGSQSKSIRLVTGGDTVYTQKARQRAKERGLRLVLFSGDNLQITQEDGSVASVRAYISGDRMFVRVDHPVYNSDQLTRHEVGHDMIAKGEIDPNTVRDRIDKSFGKEKSGQLADNYVSAYEGSGLTPQEVWEEVICDSLGDMNIFSGTVVEQQAKELLTETKQAASTENKTESTRGPPEAKASRDLPIYETAQTRKPIKATNFAEDKARRAAAAEKYGLDKVEASRLGNYVGGSLCYMLNTRMMSGKLTDGERGIIASVESALRKFPEYSGRVYRNLQFRTEQQYNAFMAEYSEGETVTLKAFTSTSKNPNGYPLFGGGVVHLVVDAQHGCDIADTFGLPRQQEVVLLPGTELKITRVTTANDGNPLIIAQEVAANEIAAADEKRDFGDQRPARGVHQAGDSRGSSDGRGREDHGRVHGEVRRDARRDGVHGNRGAGTDAGRVSEKNTVTGKFSQELPVEKAPVFYSQMERTIEAVKQDKLGAASVVSMLRGKGVKAEEIKWSGIETFLEGKKSVTKQELLEFVRANSLEVSEEAIEDTNGGVLPYTTNERQALDAMQEQSADLLERVVDLWEEAYHEELPFEVLTADDIGAAITRTVIDRNGGMRDYVGNEAITDQEWELQTIGDQLRRIDMRQNDLAERVRARQQNTSKTHWSQYKLDGGENYREYLFKMPGSEYTNNAMQAHWKERGKGVLAHARVQDFETESGKMLFIEEIQSDWHNEGHKKGYFSESEKLTVKDTEMRHENGWYNLYRDGMDLHQGVSETFLKQRFRNGISEKDIHEGLVDEYNRAIEHSGNGWKAPDAPYSKTYHEFVLKNLLRKAAEGGYDYLGWTTGKMQEERWSSDYAEGYRIEYDQDIPKFLNKYGKQWGAEVGKTKIGNDGYGESYVSDGMDDDFPVVSRRSANEVWSIPITEAMKQSVLYEGQPKFSMETPVEQTKDLVALHNLSEEKLMKSLALGGFPMPSIAVTTTDIPHTNFGDITLVMNKSTVDPKASRKNTVYSADAWTPTFPQIEYDPDENVSRRIRDKYYDLDRKYGRDVSGALYGYGNYLGDELNRNGGEEGIINRHLDDTKMMQAYLADIGGGPVESIKKETVTRIPQDKLDLYDRLISKLGEDVINEMRAIGNEDPMAAKKRWLEAYSDKFTEAYREHLANKGLDSETIDKVIGATKRGEIVREVVGARNYLAHGAETVRTETDGAATDAAIRKAAGDGYEKWLRDLFRGAVGDTGVPNNKGLFAPSGKRRSFKQTHYPVTLENIAKAMAEQNGGKTKNVSGFYGIKTLRAGTAKRFASIKEMHQYEGRLKNLTQEEADAITDALGERMSDIINKVLATKKRGAYSNDFMAYESVGNMLMEMSELKTKSIETLTSKAKEWHYDLGNALVADIRDLLFDVAQMPVNMFEAKPERVVRFDEVLAAILPDTASAKLRQQLESAGVNVLEYKRDDVESRLKAVNSVDGAKFSRDLENIEAMRQENAKLKEVNAALQDQFKRTKFAKVERKSLEKFAKQLLKDYESGADINDTRDALDGLYTYMANGIDGHSAVWEEAYQMAYDVALEVLNNAVTLDDSLWQAYKPLRDHLRKVKITLAKEDWNDLEAYGGYNEFRKANMGRLNLVKDGVPVDVAYQEMAYLWPEYFNEEEHTHPADQLAHMAEVLDGLQPIESNPYAVGMRESATWLANDIMERFFELPQAKPTFADKAERKLTQQVIKDRKKLEALREQKDQKIAKIIKQQREKTAERIKKEKADKWKKAAEVKEHYQTKEKRMSESRKARVMRAKIMRHASELQHKLLRPTDKQHVPESLRKPVAALLDAINLESGFEWEYGKDGVYHRVKRGSSPTADTTNRTKAFLKVRQAYEKILKDGAEYDGAADLVVDPDSLAIFDQVLEMRDVPIAEMTAKELQTIWDAVRLMEHSVSTAGKMLSESKHKTTAAMAEAFQEDTASRKDVKSSPVLNQLKQDLKTPYTFFSNYGQAGLDFFQVLLNAQSHEQRMQDEIAAKVTALVSKEKREALEKETVQFNGMTFSKAHVMGLYLLSKREQAVQHMTHGGIVQPEIGKIKRGVEPRMVPEMNLVQLQELLTAEERKLADEFQKLTLQLAEWGNQAAMKAYGYRKFTDPHYWPIRSASEQVNQTVEKNRDNARSIANMGSAKALNPNATNGLEVESIFETFDRHASDMMTYSAWLIPMEDANRLFNFKFKDEDGNLTGRNMQTLLNKVGGPASTKYWLELMKDIQNGIGGANDTGLARLSNKVIGNVKKASVAGNLRVVVQQPTAMMRAAAVLKPENLARFAKAPTKGSGWDKAMKYAPIAARKATGGFEVSSNPKQLAEIMYKPETKKGKVIQGLKDAPLWAPGKADEMTWGFIWNACEWQVAEDKSLDKGSESFYKATAKLFEEVIVQTQVVDGVLQRSQAMRSSNGAVKQMTAFMGEPTQTLNMVMRAYDNFRNETDPGKRTSARKKLATAATAVVFNGVLNAMAQSIIDATRDDDEEKEYLERYMTALTGLKGDEDTLGEFAKAIFLDGNLGNNLNPATWVYYLSDVVSLLKGYSIERMDASAFGDFLTAASNMEKAIAGESKWTPAYAAAKLLTTAGKLFGSSSANIMRDAESLLRTVLIAGDNWEGLYESDKMKYDLVNQKNHFLDFAYQAYAAGNTEAYEAIVEDMAKNGVDRDAIKSGMESRMKKAQGVSKVDDLTERYLFPDQEVEYDRTMSRIKSSSVWKNASGAHKDKVEDKLYEIVTGSKAGMDLQEKITEGGKYGIDETEYLLYTLALDMHDKANDNGKYGTYTNQERADAILGMGLKDNEMAYLWDKEEGYEALAAGVRMEKYIQFKADLDGIKATKNALGKVIVSREDKIIQYLNKLGVTNQEKRWLLGTVYDKYK